MSSNFATNLGLVVAILSLFVAIVGCVVAVATPETRRFIGLADASPQVEAKKTVEPPVVRPLTKEPPPKAVALIVESPVREAKSPPETPSGPPYRVGGGVSAPIPIRRPEPSYSKAAKKAQLQGSVVVGLVVNEEGKPESLRVVRPLGLGLDEEALKAVARWRFKPGMKDGKPVPVSAKIEVSFRLLD
jgi:TonB family protein